MILPLKQVKQLSLWLPGLAMAGVLGIAATTVYLKTRNDAISETPVVPAPVVAVVALGRIEPQGDVIKLSVPNAQYSRVDQILVQEGDFVKANQVVAILQGIDRRVADLRDAEADVRLRETELTKARQGDTKKAQLVRQRATIARLEAQLKAETTQRKAAIMSAKATLREAELTYQRRQALVQAGALRRADLDEAQRNLATAQATLAERQAELEQTVTTLPDEIAQEQAGLAELKEVLPVDIKIAQEQLVRAKIAVEQRRADLKDAQVRVPVAGQILRINTRTGEQVNTSLGIVELAQTQQMFAITEVAETDIGKVRKGQQVTITSDSNSFVGELQGVVEQIGLRIGKRQLLQAGSESSSSGFTTGSPTTDQDARIVEVKIRIAPKDSAKVAALTDMQVRVRLNIAAKINQGQ